MATKVNTPGLLSKLAQLIRVPASGRGDAPASEQGHTSALNQLALKERIERKRQDDNVRRREFNHLRKLRNTGPVTARFVAGPQSGFPSSVGFDPDDRAMTIKKIDDIEAQMSKHWWGRKSDDAQVNPAVAGTQSAQVPLAGAAAPPPEEEDLLAHFEFATVPMPLSGPTDRAPEDAATEQPASEDAPQASDKPDTDFSAFSSANLVSVEMGDGGGSADLQEAAIRFADGDEAAAETILLTLLQAEDIQPEAAAACAAALFDLYRATGQQASFDVVAIDYAQRFGCSAPEWFSTPDLLGRQAAALEAPAASEPGGAVWACPAQLDGAAVQALQGTPGDAAQPRHQCWARLQTLTPEAAQALAALLAHWCAQPVQLHWSGAEVLTRTLQAHTPAGDPRVDPVWWRLRLDALRILGQQDAFETAAMEFCLTYEVSPPSWQAARCVCVHDHADADAALAQAPPQGLATERRHGPHAGVAAGDAAEAGLAADADAAMVALSGEVLGDAVPALERLTPCVQGAEHLSISCRLLVRVDFAAAGSILNWVVRRQTEGCQVRFVDVPRLVAAFFGVIGITEYALVQTRTR